MSKIEVIISPDGSSRLETKGFHGSHCREGSRFLEQALGTSKDEQITEEFYRSSSGSSIHLLQDQQGSRG